MNLFVYRRMFPVVLALLVGLFVLGATSLPGAVRATSPDPITAAWQEARTAGSYQFDSNITQMTVPVAKVTNVGRTSHTNQLHLSGETDLHANRLEMQLWSDGGSILQNDGAIVIKIEDGKSYIRQDSGEWQASEGVLDGLAPQGDFLAYLQAVRDVQENPPEVRAGIHFTRYTFTVDGPAFAAYVRNQMEAALRAKGELPPGVSLEQPQYYRDMSGDGELWVGEDGLPLRQVLNLNFPEQNEQTVHAQVVVNFSHFGERVQRPASSVQHPGGWLAGLGLWAEDLGSILVLLPMTALAAMMLHWRRARLLQTALAIAVILSLVVGPVLSTFQVNSFYAAQAAKAAAQEEQQAVAGIQRDLSDALGRPEFNPQVNPLETGDQRLEAVMESPVTSPSVISLQSPNLQATDDGVDTDADGLSDFVEERVGTNPFNADTDEDGLKDGLEVKGFELGGKHWYLDPNEADSNRDGLADMAEWDNNGDNHPDDSDGDNIPDLFDEDNDNDGVPDRQDLSPFSTGGATFSEVNPLRLTLTNLTANTPTLVDFQVKPTDANHLWYAFNVLDWPRNDRQGQMQDVDGKTFADLAAVQGRTAALNESFGDLKLIPMLEIRLPANGANLPPQSDLTPYNISVSNLTADGSQKVVYVPLSLVTAEQTGARVAFTGRMRYLPGGAWPTPHDVRLAWVVQALTDIPCDHTDPQDVAAGCAADDYIHNAPQVLQSYYDDFTLTGLNVSEQHGVRTALIYEDPAVDSDLKDDEALATLAYGLDNSFLSGRDADNNGQRDVDIAEIVRRFDHTTNGAVSSDQRWGLDNELNILKVEQHDYATFDQAAIYTAMTGTLKLLTTQFHDDWANDNSIKPTIAYAYEQRSRSVGLDDTRASNGYLTLNSNNVAVNLQPAGKSQAPLNVIAGMKWMHYCRADSNAAWAVCTGDDYWNELENRYGASATLPGDPADPDIAAGRLFSLQLLDLGLTQGIERAVQTDSRLISSQYSRKSDPELASDIRLAAAGSKLVVVVADFLIMRSFDQAAAAAKYFGELRKSLPTGTVRDFKNALKALKGDLHNNKLRGTGVAVTALVVLGGLATAAYFQNRGEQGAAIAIRAFVISAQVILSIYGPISAVNAWRTALTEIGSSASILTSQTELIGVSRMATAIGAVIAVSIVWGFFIYSMVSNKVSAFSAEFNAALAETVAATIYIVLLAVLSSTVVGLIIVGVVAVIDAILTAVCELGVDDLRTVPGLGGACFTLGTATTKAIARLIYNYDVMIDTGRNDLVAPGAPTTRLATPSKGFVTGNDFTITMPITTHVVHKNPDPSAGIMINFYLYLFSKENLRSSTFNYSLTQPDPQDVSASRDQMSGAWQNVSEDHKYVRTPMYGGYAQSTHTVGGFNLQPGLNRPASFYLNMGYALPAYECWYIPVLVFYGIPVCYTRTFTNNSSSQIETMRYDIFPDTIGGFMTLGNKSGGVGLNWDAAFPALRDADGDGLVSGSSGGLDPNDTRWDSDNDGLADAYELAQRAAGALYSPVQCDSDSDGLTDAQEAHFGTNPASADSDNDGLPDAAEVWRRVYDTSTCQPTGAWSGGWDVTINAATPFTVRVSSDPTQHDSDGDGVSDLAEMQLAGQLDRQNRPYHPGVVNLPPIAVHTETDRRYVAPGGNLVYTTTVVANAAMAPGVLDVVAPTQLGGVRAAYPLNFNPGAFTGSQTVAQQTVLTAQAGLNTQTASLFSNVRTRLAPTGPGGLAWDPIVFNSLGNQGQPTHFMAVAHSGRNGLDNYLLTSLNTDSNGAGTLRSHVLPSGPQSSLSTATPPGNILTNNRTDVACNGAGVCLIVWEERISGPFGAFTRLYGAIIGADGQAQPKFWLADMPAFRPVVASDGNDFVVVYEMALPGTPATTQLNMARFNAAGSRIATSNLTIESPRVAAPDQASVGADLVWIGDRYRVAWKFIRAGGFRPFPQIYVGDLDRNGAPLDSLMTSVAFEAHETEAGAPALAYDPVNNLTLLLYVWPNGDVHRVLFKGADLTPWLRDDLLGGLGIPNTTGNLSSGETPLVAYNPLADGWLVQLLFGNTWRVILLKPALDGRLLADVDALDQVFGGSDTGMMACPANASMLRPVADFRFEELPGATTFADGSGGGFNATCSGNACPVAGAAGATNAAGNPIGGGVQGLSSDYGLSFTDANQTITFPSPLDLQNDSFSIAFWYRDNDAGDTSTFILGETGGAMRVHITPDGNGSLNFFVDGKWVTGPSGLNDGDWHAIVVTRDKVSGQRKLYVDGAAAPSSEVDVQPIAPGATMRAGHSMADLDQLRIYKSVLSNDAVQALYNNTMQAYCVVARPYQSQPHWYKLNVSEIDARGGKIAASGGMTITIDADKPTSTLAGLTNNQFIRGPVYTLGGNSNDATSGVAKVEVNINNAGWQPASGTGSWAYNLVVDSGAYTIQTRATDAVGNVETPAAGITVQADNTAPNVTLNAIPSTPSKPTRNTSDQWMTTLAGTVSDAGSGVQWVEVLLQGQGDATGNGWQAAVQNGNHWNIDYLFAPGLADPTGAYTVSVRGIDQVGNQSADDAATGVLRLDAAGPAAALTSGDATRQIISDTLTISGVLTDTGAAGVDKLEIAFVSVEQIAALPADPNPDQADAQLNRTWLAAAVAQHGAGVSAWSVQVPDGLEGEYQIDLRATDMLGNILRHDNAWRGVIDTLAPRVVVTSTRGATSWFDPNSGLQMYDLAFTCAASDRYLNDATFRCPAGGAPVRSFDNNPALQALFPDRTILNVLTVSASYWGADPDAGITISACDAYGHCSTSSQPPAPESRQEMVSSLQPASVESQAQVMTAPGAPFAVVVAPTAGSYVAADGDLAVTVAAEAGAALKEVTIRLDNHVVQTLNFAQSENATRILRTFQVTDVSEGQHTLTAHATDWAGGAQAGDFPVTFTLDAQPPVVTIDSAPLTNADTWAVGSGVLRFNGTASDANGLAAVQIREGTGAFADVGFGNGVWQTALPITDPEGRTLELTVRAIDRAGRISEVTQSIGTDLSGPDAPDTTITASPANPSDAHTATFEFNGATPSGSTAVAFKCQLDTEAYTACASPWAIHELSKGEHTFRVRAIDGAGNVDLTPASFTWTVKASVLDATITLSPANPSSSRNARFEFTGTGIGFECALNAAVFAACTSGQTYTGLDYGNHIFAVRAVNGSGQTGTAAAYTWSIVNTPPIANDQTVVTNQETLVEMVLTANDVDALTYQVVNPPTHGVLVGAAPHLSYIPNTGFAGADSFTFRADDGQSNSNVATVSISVQSTDGAAPVSTITLAPAAPDGQNGWYKSAVQVTVAASDGSDAQASGVAEMRCVLDPAGVPTSFDDLPAGCDYTDGGGEVGSDGAHTLYAASRDNSGNQETPVSVSFHVDRTPPVVSVAGVNGGATYALGNAPTATCQTTDVTSGPATAATVSVSGGNAHGVGAFTATCSSAADKAGNASVAVSAVYTVGYDLNKFVILAEEGVALAQQATVNSGSVGAQVASNGPFLANNAEVSIAQQAKLLEASSHLLGDTLAIRQQASVYNPSYNTWTNQNGTIHGTVATPLNLRLLPALPALPAIMPGTENLAVAQRQSLTVQPGSYGALTVGQQGTVIFSGGVYHFQSWSVGQQAKIYFQAASEIRIAGRVSLGQATTLGPATIAPTLSAREIVLYVAGQNGNGGGLNESPKSVAIGQRSTLNANILAPNGTVHFDQAVTATGAFLARWVNASQQVNLSLDSRFGASGAAAGGLRGEHNALYLPLIQADGAMRRQAVRDATIDGAQERMRNVAPQTMATEYLIETSIPASEAVRINEGVGEATTDNENGNLLFLPLVTGP